jgi:[ribosomal protein S5]-alanine N-acetyltransferase
MILDEYRTSCRFLLFARRRFWLYFCKSVKILIYPKVQTFAQIGHRKFKFSTMYPELETRRLRLRPIGVSDAVFLQELMNTPGWLRFIGDRSIHSLIDAEKYVEKLLENAPYFYHVIFLKETEIAIGILTFLHRNNSPYPDLGFAILPTLERQGFVTEACQKCLGIVWQERTDEFIQGIVLPDNQSSIRLLEKLGFEFHDTHLSGEEKKWIFSLKRPGIYNLGNE